MIRATHMFRRSVLAVAAAALLAAPSALAGGTSQLGPHDTWYPYARSLMKAQQPDPWLRYAIALTSRARSAEQTSLSFTTDTLGGSGHPQQAPVAPS
jgi:ABC-type sugar transport system substrate-binding protein